MSTFNFSDVERCAFGNEFEWELEDKIIEVLKIERFSARGSSLEGFNPKKHALIPAKIQDYHEGTDIYIGGIPVDVSSNTEKLENELEVLARIPTRFTDIVLGIRRFNGYNHGTYRLKMPVLVIGFEAIPGFFYDQLSDFRKAISKFFENSLMNFQSFYFDWLLDNLDETEKHWKSRFLQFADEQIKEGNNTKDGLLEKANLWFPEYHLFDLNEKDLIQMVVNHRRKGVRL